MCKKLIFLVSPILLLVPAGNAMAQIDPSTVTTGHVYFFDNVSGSELLDDSANNNTGTIVGDPQVVDGLKGEALMFDGVDDIIRIPDSPNINSGGPWTNRTVIALFKCDDVTKQDKQTIYEEGGRTRGLVIYVFEGEVYVGGWNRSEYNWNGAWLSAPVNSNNWHAVAFVIRDGTGAVEDDKFEMWLDGNLIGKAPGGQIHGHGDDNGIGATNQNTVFHDDDGSGSDRDFFAGAIDEIWILNDALTETELGAFVGKVWPYAFSPTPTDGAMYEDTWLNLFWKPGGFAVSHDVYFGENFDDVNAGAEGTFIGNQAGIDFIVGFPGFAFPDGLVPGTTYYWRVDEVNEAEPNSPWKGNVWSFSIPPKTAYFPDPADGAESVDPNADLSWTAGFGAVLHYSYFGDNFDDVNNATGAFPLGDATFDPGPMKLAKTYYWRVDEFDVLATYKGDVWSFTTEGAVAALAPSNGAVDVKQTQILTWSPSVFAASHEVYFGADKDAVKNADTGSPEYKGTRALGSDTYDPGMLEWDTTYYWRIDEVNNTNPDSPWVGPLWNFTTANFLVVDDFEDYDVGNNEIWWVWVDGLGYASHPTLPPHPGNGTGSMVGDETTGSYMEETIVHGGNQSMPVFYDNSILRYSEVEMTLTYPRDWTENGVTTLSIWFRGDSANSAETLYVVLNGSAVVTNDNPNAAQITRWTEWTIDLQAFADQGVNLVNVNTIGLGLGDRNNPQAGGSGTMYFDDIRLYPPPPAP
jgi:hypothetical protein